MPRYLLAAVLCLALIPSFTSAQDITHSVSFEVLFPPTSPKQRDYDDVQNYLLNKSAKAFPYISGAVLRVDWSDFDLGDASTGKHTRYDFKIIDDAIAPWIAAGKTANLVLHTTPYGGPPSCPGNGSGSHGQSGVGNCAMPAWMWTALGNSNYITCDGAQAPNFFADAFQSNYEAAIKALTEHYAQNKSVSYIRVGLGKGGEINLPRGWQDPSTPCGEAYTKRWGYTIGNSDKYTWNAYLEKMLDFEGSLHSSRQLMVSITPVQAPGVNPQEVSDFIAPIAVKNGIGFGNQGLGQGAMRNCTSMQADWCALFERYQGQVPLELQTLGPTCPTCEAGSQQGPGQGQGRQGAWQNRNWGQNQGGGGQWGGQAGNQGQWAGRRQGGQGQGGQQGGGMNLAKLSQMTGPLPPLIPFAIKNHATIIELYTDDWLIAFSQHHPQNRDHGDAYAQAIQGAAK
ncbi:MAG: hypothetical protein WB729_15070 [Candidatus Sulfotelmatobacter sp.]